MSKTLFMEMILGEMLAGISSVAQKEYDQDWETGSIFRCWYILEV